MRIVSLRILSMENYYLKTKDSILIVFFFLAVWPAFFTSRFHFLQALPHRLRSTRSRLVSSSEGLRLGFGTGLLGLHIAASARWRLWRQRRRVNGLCRLVTCCCCAQQHPSHGWGGAPPPSPSLAAPTTTTATKRRRVNNVWAAPESRQRYFFALLRGE